MVWHWQRSVGALSPVLFLSTRKGSTTQSVEGSPGWGGVGDSDVEGEAEAAGLF